jgi:hypothetical protein
VASDISSAQVLNEVAGPDRVEELLMKRKGKSNRGTGNRATIKRTALFDAGQRLPLGSI